MINSSRKTLSGPGAEADLIREVSRLVSEITGVQLGDRQRIMVQSRLSKRMLDLGLVNHAQYLEYLSSHEQTEITALVSLLTTHHTYFFREYAHFEYLERAGLQNVVDAARKRGERKITVWSAACSRGQEVYSLSMFLTLHLKRIAPDFAYEIVGSDVDPESVEIARNGVYNRQEIKEVPAALASGHWANGTGDIAHFVKAKQSIKAPCTFTVGNLLALPASLMVQKFDLIFCRNVFIYFTPQQIEKICESFIINLRPEGILFVGISESLHGLNLPLTAQGPSVYSHKKLESIQPKGTSLSLVPNGESKVYGQVPSQEASRALAPVKKAETLKILCVDDSPSIITLLKQLLKPEHGFEVVGTAVNGLDAAEKLKSLKVDLMTLDIHMPEQTGLEYLQAHFKKGHPPVVMISSVSRDDSSLAMRCLDLGAADYIEKPTLSNMSERGDEIRSKLLCAYRNRVAATATSLGYSNPKGVHPTIKNPESCIRLIFAGLSDRPKLAKLLQELSGAQPPTLILTEGCESALPAYVKKSTAELGASIQYLEGSVSEMKSGKVYIGDFGKLFDSAHSKYGHLRTSIIIYGIPSKKVVSKIPHWGKASLLVEDLGPTATSALKEIASDTVPATSFAYMSIEYLGRDE